MANTDFTKVMQDMMASFPVDTSAMQNAFKTQAAMGEKFAKWLWKLLKSRPKSLRSGQKTPWPKLADVSKAKTEAAEYGVAAKDFASAAAEMAAENMASFAEIAKKVQMETVELMLAAGKDLSAETTAAVKKASADVDGCDQKGNCCKVI